MMAERLAGVDVREMDLDYRQFRDQQRIAQRDRGVGEAGGVDDDAVGVVARLVDPLDELALVVALAELDRDVELGRALLARDLDVAERLATVDLRLAHAEHVEVGPVQHEHDRAAVQGSPPADCGLLLAGL